MTDASPSGAAVVPRRAPSWSRGLLEHPAGAYACALAFLLVTGWIAVTQRFLHDEAVFTYDQVVSMYHAPVAALFFPKGKPLLMLLYALPSALGFQAYVLAHAAVSAGAVLLVSAAARRLGLDAPNVAGWLLAASLHFTIGAGNGYPNSDGAFLLALALYLYAREKHLAAALLLGAFPLARQELAAVSLAFAAWDLWHRRSGRFLLALALPMTVYTLAGAVYQRDLLWLVHRFPVARGLPESIRMDSPLSPLDAVRALRKTLLGNAPLLGVFGLAVALRPRGARLAPVQLSFAVVYLLMTALQVTRLMGFDTSPRYYITALPLLAVLAAAGLSSDTPRGARATWAIALAVALLCAPAGTPALACLAVLLLAALVHFAWRKPWFSRALLLAASAAYLAPGLRDDSLRERQQHLGFHRLMARLRARGVYDGRQPLYTDTVIARYDRHVGIGEQYFLLNDAMVWEIRTLLNPDNGQRDALLGAASSFHALYDSERFQVRRDGVYLLRALQRVQGWRARLEAAGATRVDLGTHEAFYFPNP